MALGIPVLQSDVSKILYFEVTSIFLSRMLYFFNVFLVSFCVGLEWISDSLPDAYVLVLAQWLSKSTNTADSELGSENPAPPQPSSS